MTEPLAALPNLIAARALIDGLLEAGVAHAVVAPGSRSTPLVVALARAARHGRIIVHTIVDERSAAFFALGLARASGRPAALVATSGSAGAHFLPAVIEASETGVPLVVVTADRPPELHGVGAPQTTAQRAFYALHTRWAVELPVPERGAAQGAFTTAALRAIERATAAKPGPVHVNAPFREPLWSAEAEAALDAQPEARAPVRLWGGARRLDDAALDELARTLASAERGLLVMGPMSDRVAAAALRALAAHLGWPLVADAGSQARSGDAAGPSPLLITRADAIARAALPALGPDRVLKVGRAPSSRALHEWLERHAAGRVLLLDAGGDVVDHGHLAGALIAAEPAATARDLIARLPAGPRDSRWLAAWREAEAIAAATLDAPSATLWEGAVARQVARAVPAGGLLFVGSGMPVRDVDGQAGPLAPGVHVIVNRGANGIDGALSTAAGAARAASAEAAAARRAPPPALIALIGDLTALHDLSGLRLLRDTKVVAVVVDNGGGGIFEFLPIAQHPRAFEEHFLTPQPDDLVSLCRGLGLRAIDTPSEATLARALAEALEAPASTVIRVPIDRRANVEAHRARWTECTRALERALRAREREEMRDEHCLVQGA